MMSRKGINYDTGFTRFGDRLSRESFVPAQVRREMAVIARDLHCTAVRISGRDPERIALAAEYALGEGLEVWFAPFPCNMAADELLPYFVTCAKCAEGLRQQSQSVVFVLGCEMSLYNHGFFPGADYLERLQTMMDPALLANPSFSPARTGSAVQCLPRAGGRCGAGAFRWPGDVCIGIVGTCRLAPVRHRGRGSLSGCEQPKRVRRAVAPVLRARSARGGDGDSAAAPIAARRRAARWAGRLWIARRSRRD